MLKQCLAIIFSIALISTTANSDDVSSPNNIPLFDNYATPVIKPGEGGFFSFKIQNRYDKNMDNVSLTLEIYFVELSSFMREKETKDVRDVANAPKFVNDDANINVNAENQKATSNFGNPNKILKNDTKEIRIKISTEQNTPQGVYFIRTIFEFDYENKHYVMKSIGHFSKEHWKNITNTPETDTDGINETYLNSLGTKAIIPESSFAVKEPFPTWILYVLIGIASFFLVMAIVFYIRDERKRK